MIITRELAQKIVDIIMPMVKHNINIMNNAGVIIGSGQPFRINSIHQGAIEVIHSGSVLEIHSGQVERFPGSQPGLNWPIVFNNQIVGVVGISGAPELVRDTARLVKMVTELLLERESLVEEFRSHLQLGLQLIRLLLAKRFQENYEQIAHLAKMLCFQLDIPRIVAVISMEPFITEAVSQYGEHDLITARIEEALAGRLDASDLINDRYDLYVFGEKELIVLKHFPAGAMSADIGEWGSRLYAVLDKEKRCGEVKIGIGGLATTPAELRYSYQEADFSRSHAVTTMSVASIYDFAILADYLLEVPGAMECCLALKAIRAFIEKSIATKYDMENTVRGLLNSNLNVSIAAKALYIHRNTLVFRLNKLKELTGLCPNQFFHHAVLCKIIFRPQLSD